MNIITCNLQPMSISVYACPSSYYLQQGLLLPTFKQVGLKWLHAQGKIFIAECYGHAACIHGYSEHGNFNIKNNLSSVAGTHRLGRLQNNVLYHCSQLYSIVRYIIALIKPWKWSGVHILTKAIHCSIQLTAVQDLVVIRTVLYVLSDFRNMLQWANRT